MKQKYVVAIILAVILFLYSLNDATTKTASFGDATTARIEIVEKYGFVEGTNTVSIKFKNRWADIPLLHLVNPIILTVENYDQKGRKIVEIPYRFKDFTEYGYYHGASKKVTMNLYQFSEINRIEIK